jgi:nicotinamidase-related amidase
MLPRDTVYLALHYQNENCHHEGNIKVGMGRDCPWREERLGNAAKLMAGCRAQGIPIVHVRLAVRPDYADVTANTPIIREWIASEAWQEGSWGCEFLADFEPLEDEFVVTHTRNSALIACETESVLNALGAKHLLISGVSTAYVVECTVRHATDIGYPCTVASDACSTATQVQHDNALAAMSLLCDVHTVNEVLATMDGSA